MKYRIDSAIKEKGYATKVVAAAIPYDLYLKSLSHPLTESGTEKFEEDWRKVK